MSTCLCLHVSNVGLLACPWVGVLCFCRKFALFCCAPTVTPTPSSCNIWFGISPYIMSPPCLPPCPTFTLIRGPPLTSPTPPTGFPIKQLQEEASDPTASSVQKRCVSRCSTALLVCWGVAVVSLHKNRISLRWNDSFMKCFHSSLYTLSICGGGGFHARLLSPHTTPSLQSTRTSAKQRPVS